MDADTKISANTLGSMVLKKSGLDREEKNIALARADETFNFTKVSTTLNNLFPTGSKSRSGGGLRPREPRRWAYPADGNDEEFEDGEDVVFSGLYGKVTREVENSDEVCVLFFSSNYRTAYQNGCSDTPSKPKWVLLFVGDFRVHYTELGEPCTMVA